MAVRQPKILTLQTAPTMVGTTIQDHLMLVYGPPGVGKTTFVNELYLQRVLFISTDRGTRTLAANRIEANTWDQFQDVLYTLEQKTAYYREHFDCVCIDHVDDMAGVFEAQVCKKFGVDYVGDDSIGFGKGWKLLRTSIEQYVQRLLAMHFAVVFIAHEDQKLVKTRTLERNVTMPSMSKSTAKVIMPLADIVGYCGFAHRPKLGGGTEEIRIIDTTPRDSLHAKDRTHRNRPLPGQSEYLDGHAFRKSFEGIDPSTFIGAMQDGDTTATSSSPSNGQQQPRAGSQGTTSRGAPQRRPGTYRPSPGPRTSSQGTSGRRAGQGTTSPATAGVGRRGARAG